jgi:hypothetical protein
MNMWISDTMFGQKDALSAVGKKGLIADSVANCASAFLAATVQLTTFTACPSSHPSQEITNILWNRSQQPALVPVVSHMHPVHTLPPYFCKLLFNIVTYAQSQRSSLQQLQCTRMSLR